MRVAATGIGLFLIMAAASLFLVFGAHNSPPVPLVLTAAAVGLLLLFPARGKRRENKR
jgi:hypothetical protein